MTGNGHALLVSSWDKFYGIIVWNKVVVIFIKNLSVELEL